MAHAEKSIKHCEEARLATVLGGAWQFCGWGHLFLGELEIAREQVEKGHAQDSAAGMSLVSSLYYQVMSDICLESLDWEGARKYADDGLKCARTQGATIYEGTLGVRLGTALAKIDSSQHTEAERLLLEGMRILDELKLRPHQAEGHFYLGGLYADMGQKEEALARLKKAKGMFQDMGMDYWLARAEKALEKLEK